MSMHRKNRQCIGAGFMRFPITMECSAFCPYALPDILTHKNALQAKQLTQVNGHINGQRRVALGRTLGPECENPKTTNDNTD
eukprot:1156364-Pelagomonas_calceolata.AAC.1